MNRQEAKAVLEMYRPGGEDANDPQFAEALELVQRDAELARWFAEQQAFDTRMSANLKTLSVPANLKASLLAQWKPAEKAVPKARPAWLEAALSFLETPILPGRRIMGSPLWRYWQARVAVAVSLACLAIVAGLWSIREPTSFARYRQEVVEASWEGTYHLDLVNSDLSEVRQWLVRQNAEGRFSLPAPLANAHIRGCRVLEWRGRKVACLCFLDGSRHLHLFIAESEDFPDEPTLDSPQFEKCERWQTVSWTQGNSTFILSGLKYTTFVKRFRKGGQWLLGGE